MNKQVTVALRDSGTRLESACGNELPMVDELVYCTVCGLVEVFGGLRWNQRARKPDIRCGGCWSSWMAGHIVWWVDARERLGELGIESDGVAAGDSVPCPMTFWLEW